MTIAAVQRIGEVSDERAWREDRALLRRAAGGDDDAFRRIVEANEARLLRLCERMLGDAEEARDAVQEVFLKAYRKAGRFEPRGRLYTWLYRIAVNHCLNQVRRRRLVRFLGMQGAEDSPPIDVVDERPGPDRALDARRGWIEMRRWLDDLPASQRAVVVLARFEGLSYLEIAETLGITLGAVESRLFRAMRTLERRRDERSAGGGAA